LNAAFRGLRSLLFVVAAAAVLASACGEGDGSVRVFAASSLQDVLPKLLGAYAETDEGARFEVQYGGSQSLATQIELGADADLFLSANAAQIERLEVEDHIEWQISFVSNCLVIAVDEDSSIATIDGLGASGVRIALGASDVPVGALTDLALAMLDPSLAEAIRANVVTEDPNVRVVLSRLELGEVEAVFVYSTDVAVLEDVRAIEVGGVEPNVYVGGVTSEGGDAAASLLAFLAGHEAVPIWEAAGFEPLNVAVGAR
jgi:molybdate transport system substrate-binding protein